MNVLLINSNYIKGVYGAKTGAIAPPLGLAYVAASLRKSGIEVSILDANALSLKIEEVRREIENRKPDVVGVTAPTALVGEVEGISRIAKDVNKDIIVLVGGPHPSALPQDMLVRSETIDVCVVGEGEYTAVELLQTLDAGGDLSKIRGIVYRKGKDIIENERRPPPLDLDILPFPAWDLLPMDKYRYNLPLGKKGGYFDVVSSRGCPYNCIFCAHSTIFGRKVRYRTAKNLVDEVEQLVRHYGITALSFTNSNFTLSRQRTFDICDELIRREIDIRWQTNTRVHLVDFELLTKMKQAGCDIVTFGVEAGNQKVLDILAKGITIEDARKAVKMSKKAGLRVYTNFMIGSPGETTETIADTIALAKELDSDYTQFSITTLLPGTELFNMAEKEGQIGTYDWSKFKFYTPIFGMEGLPADELEKLQAKAFTSFYLRPSYMVKQALRVRSLGDIKRLLQGFITLRLLTKNKK